MTKQLSSEATTVDNKGIVHNTVADNIRSFNNAPEQQKMDLKSMLDVLYPVGSYFIGMIPASWLLVTKWAQIKASQPIGYLYYNTNMPSNYWSTGLYQTLSTTKGTTSISQPTYNIPILQRLA